MTVEERIDEPDAPPDEPEAGEAAPPLTGQARAMRIVLVASVIAVAAAAAIFAVADRQGDDQLILHITHPRSISPRAVEKTIASAPEPTVSGPGKAKAVQTTC